jgi:saccharopine dehydrogenase-like NADP-dependent oxidoreductase
MKSERKRYVIAGAGGIGTAAGVLLAVVGREDCDLVLWDSDPEALKRAHDRMPRDGHVRSVETLHVPPGETPEALHRVLAAADIVLDCLPGAAAPGVAQLCLDHRLHYANLTEHVAETDRILAMTRGAETGFVLQTGLAPGFINVVALRLFHDFCRDFRVETVERIKMRVGALTVNAQAPHFYGFTWSASGVATEYLEPAVVVRGGEKTTRPSLSERETLIIDGVAYEEDLTSGGAADLPDALAGRCRDLDYKTLRYPGHYDWVAQQVAALGAGGGGGDGRHAALQEMMEREIPRCEEDRVVVYAAVQGRDERGVPHLREEVHHVHPVELGGVRLRAIQTSTAAPLVEVAHMLLKGGYRGPVLQSEIDPYDFLGGRFVSRIYGT